jgi:hypothetical protein
MSVMFRFVEMERVKVDVNIIRVVKHINIYGWFLVVNGMMTIEEQHFAVA